ncbi:unnamed protein product [Nesidiocoris tenuis]|uniref:Uncharacterized protein n=1 Tax=Nesidiocoris tenuis TaxID=355587 RepID=A0A6H5HM22_9HEMI|nr:unnamed protein product [Nesidiocoris tenuis]
MAFDCWRSTCALHKEDLSFPVHAQPDIATTPHITHSCHQPQQKKPLHRVHLRSWTIVSRATRRRIICCFKIPKHPSGIFRLEDRLKPRFQYMLETIYYYSCLSSRCSH